MWLTEWLTPHITTLSRGSLARKSFTFCATKCFFLVFVLLAMDAAMLLAEAIFQQINQLLSYVWKKILDGIFSLEATSSRLSNTAAIHLACSQPKCSSCFLHAIVTQVRSTTQPDLDKQCENKFLKQCVKINTAAPLRQRFPHSTS